MSVGTAGLARQDSNEIMHVRLSVRPNFGSPAGRVFPLLQLGFDRCTELALEPSCWQARLAPARCAAGFWSLGLRPDGKKEIRSSTCSCNGRQYLDSSNRNPKSTAVTRNRIETPYLQL